MNHIPTVLVVDADPAILALLSALLEENNIRALRARTVAEAMEIAARQYVPIDVLLTDITLPEANLTRFTAGLLAIRPAVKVMYMSAFEDAGVLRIELLKAGNEILSASNKGLSLAAAIRSLLAAPAASRARLKSATSGM